VREAELLTLSSTGRLVLHQYMSIGVKHDAAAHFTVPDDVPAATASTVAISIGQPKERHRGCARRCRARVPETAAFLSAPLALRENFKFNRVLHEHLVIVVPHDCQPGIRGIAYPWGQSSTPLPSPAPHVRHLRALGTSSLAASRLSTKHSVKLVRATARSSRASVSRRLPRKADEFKDTRQLSKNAKAAVPAVKCSGEYGAFRRDDRRSAIRSSRW
jgi:hypothetical protein